MCNTVGTSVNLEAGCLFVVMVVFFFSQSDSARLSIISTFVL